MDQELLVARERLAGQAAARASVLVDGPAEPVTEPAGGEEPAKPAGPPDRTREDFGHIPDHNSRRAAHLEYQRTLNEFRETGAVAEKTWHDFAHLINPPGLSAIVFQAHCDACEGIERWQEQQAKAEESRKAERRRAFHEAELAEREREKQPAPAEEEEEDVGAHGAPRYATVSEAPADAPFLPQGSVPVPCGGLLRGVPFNPDAPGRMAPYEPAIPRLEVAPAPERLPAVEDQTEALLNAIIGECHFYMREVTFPSLCHARIADDRMGWLTKAVQLAETGAKVGKAVARLRHGPGMKETRHTTTIVQNRVDAAQGGGG